MLTFRNPLNNYLPVSNVLCDSLCLLVSCEFQCVRLLHANLHPRSLGKQDKYQIQYQVQSTYSSASTHLHSACTLCCCSINSVYTYQCLRSLLSVTEDRTNTV